MAVCGGVRIGGEPAEPQGVGVQSVTGLVSVEQPS